jgi:cytochrome c551/c552
MPRTALRVLPALLLLAACRRTTWVVPPAPAGAPALQGALEDAFARAAARREADYREIVAPGSNERSLANELSARDLEAWVRAGEELFVRDVRTGPVNPLRRAGAGEPAVADATRCAGCHHRGGQAGAGSYADLAYYDAPDGDLLRARPRLPPMLVGAALLELAARDDRSRQPFGRAPGRPRRLRDMIAACAAEHLGARWDEAHVDAVAAWLAVLPEPIAETRMRDALLLRAARGRAAFQRVGCASCHTPSLAVSQPVLALGEGRGLDLRARLSRDGEPPYTVWAYSDLRAHDLGAALADPDGSSHFVTAALWGLDSRGPYLHDGRAATVPEAIEAHAGEAAAARQQYRALPGPEQSDLRIFLASLTRPPAVEGVP